ncbi:hypothetical protein ABK040_001576 [Willaertia magna]
MGQGWLETKTNSVLEKVEEKQKEAKITERLIELKQLKRRRDYEIATKMATTRDRVYWLGGFYFVMGGVSFGRMIVLRRFAPLPFDTLPFMAVPFWMAYQYDFAFGNKANRINKEALKILNEEEGHWFNEPIELPELLKPHYHKYFEETNKTLIEMGKPPEKHWAK